MNQFYTIIKSNITSTYNKNVQCGFGGFGGVYKINETQSIIQSIDGIGTKSLLSFRYHSKQNLINLGHDTVANNVNDTLVLGAKPITFMDYTGTNKLNSQDLQYIIQGISESCKKNNICLIAGETAEMSSVYRHDNNNNGNNWLCNRIIRE